MELLNKLSQHVETVNALKWEGTFKDYLELVKKNPKIAQNAHARIYDMIMEAGVEELENGKMRYRFFSDTLFGVDEMLEKLVNEYFKPAAMGLDVKKRLLLLMGPVSGAKSTLVTSLKEGMEKYSYTENGAFYAIKGCPMRQEPLLMIPKELRAEFEAELGVKIEGELNPYTQHLIETEYDGSIENVMIERIFFSENKRVGIGTFSPSDPKSQDIADLVGNVDFSTLATYGSESDPRAYRFDGEFNVANRGLMEFQEVLKCDEKFLWHLLSLTQEGNFKAGRFALISADEVIVAHTNETEFNNFIKNKKNEALLSRMLILKVPYNLSMDAEARIYEKRLGTLAQSVEIAPFSLIAVAIFTILTRLKESKETRFDLLQKFRGYNGIFSEEMTEEIVAKLKDEHIDEGMSGVDPRFIINRISSVMVNSKTGFVDGFDLLKSIKDGVKQDTTLDRNTKERYYSLIEVAKKEYRSMIKEKVENVLLSTIEVDDSAIFDGYVENLKKYMVDSYSADLDVMRELEGYLGIRPSAVRSFREELYERIVLMEEKTGKFEVHLEPEFVKAMSKIRMAESRKMLHTISSEKKEMVISQLVSSEGFSRECAEKLTEYATEKVNSVA